MSHRDRTLPGAVEHAREQVTLETSTSPIIASSQLEPRYLPGSHKGQQIVVL